jgi:hypothetical protein
MSTSYSKSDNKSPVQKGILTTTMAAEGDTGASCLATDTMIDIIHNYVEFEMPHKKLEYSQMI